MHIGNNAIFQGKFIYQKVSSVTYQVLATIQTFQLLLLKKKINI